MGGLTRFDIFRIVVPGGALVVLVDLCVRIIIATPSLHSSLSHLPGFLERPVVGIAAAFAFGLFLYFVDIGYGAPQFYRRIPSTELRKILNEKGRGDIDALSAFFIAQDALMPPPMAERALLYGALYRLMFPLVLFTFVAANLLPLMIVAISKRPLLDVLQRHPSGIAPSASRYEVAGAVVLFAWIVVPFGREWMKQAGRRGKLGRAVPILALIAASSEVACWINYCNHFIPGPRPLAWIEIDTIIVLTWWFLLRVSGPIGPRWNHLRGKELNTTGSKPDQPHSPIQISCLDSVVAAGAGAGAIAITSFALTAQTLGIEGLAIVALILAFFRKHERQLEGGYRNQKAWLEQNIEEVIAMAAPQERIAAKPLPVLPPQQFWRSRIGRTLIWVFGEARS